MFITNYQGNSYITYFIDVNIEAWQSGVACPALHSYKWSSSFWHWLVLTPMLSLFTNPNRWPGRLLLSFIFVLFSPWFPWCLTVTVLTSLEAVCLVVGIPLSMYSDGLGVSEDPWAMGCPAPVTEGRLDCCMWWCLLNDNNYNCGWGHCCSVRATDHLIDWVTTLID